MAGFSARGVFAEKFERLKAQTAKVKEKARQGLKQGLQTVEVNGACFAFSYANALSGTPDPKRPGVTRLQILNIDADLVVGLGLHGLALFGGFSEYAEHAHSIGDGSLASFTARLGTEMGSDARVKAAAKTKTAGPRITSGGVKVSGVEIQNAAVARY
jgi:hypothetical protein